MEKSILSADNKKSILIAFLIVFVYAAERVLELFVPGSRTLGILLAMAYTVLLAFTLYSLYKIKDTYYGLLAALLGYKMMPVSVSFLYEYSHSASMLYFIVQKAAMLMFIALIYQLYILQDTDREKRVSAPAVFAIIFSVPFFSVIAKALTSFFLERTGSMLYGYFSQFIIYAFATILILVIAYESGEYTLRFTVIYELIALVINTLKVGAKISYRILNGWHISKSFYVWLVVYAFLMICFIVALRLKNNKKC